MYYHNIVKIKNYFYNIILMNNIDDSKILNYINKIMSENNELLSSEIVIITFLHSLENYRIDELSNIIKKRKYLVPKDILISYFLCIVKQKMSSIDSKKALIMFCDNKMLNPTQNIGIIHYDYLSNKKFDDKYLYIFLTLENTFG